jgi:lipopolysaccharide export system protein LptA
MSPSSKSVAINMTAILAGVAVCVAAGIGVKKVTSVDPMRKYKAQNEVKDLPGVVMTNFDWKAYNKSELVAEAHVKEAAVGRDRDTIQLMTVSNGKFYDKSKVAFRFEAQSAVYFNDLNTLSGTGKTRVYNDQMDVATTEFKYDPGLRAVIVPHALSGKLQGGDFKADTLKYKLDDKSIEVGGIRWSGMVAQDNEKRAWTFTPQDDKSKLNSKSVGGKTVFNKLKATDGEIIILADGGEYDRDSDVLVAKGHVQYFGSDANLVCDQVTVYRKDKRALMVGNVDMLIKPKGGGKPEQITIPPVTPIVPEQIKNERPAAPPGDTPQSDQKKQIRSGENIRDYPATVTAQRIEYWYGKGNKHAVITGSPQARQELTLGAWRMVWADSAYYDGEKETLDLKSKGENASVRMLNSLGDDLHAESVLVSTKEGDDMLDATGLTNSTVIVDKDELPEKGKGGGTAGGGDKPPPALRGPIGKKG